MGSSPPFPQCTLSINVGFFLLYNPPEAPQWREAFLQDWIDQAVRRPELRQQWPPEQSALNLLLPRYQEEAAVVPACLGGVPCTRWLAAAGGAPQGFAAHCIGRSKVLMSRVVESIGG